MNTDDRISYSIGFIDCMGMFAQASGNVNEAQLKKHYVREKVMKEIIETSGDPMLRAKIILLMEDMDKERPYTAITDIMKQKVDTDNMKKVLKKSDLFDFGKLE